MKYNINKMQNGGGIPPFTMLQPILVNNASSKRYDYGMEWDSSSSSSGSRSSKKSSSSDNDDTKGELTDKDIFSYLKDLDGLESDMNGIFKELRNFYALKGYGALNTENLALKAVSIMHKIKVANSNAKWFAETCKVAKEKNSFSEFAVTGHDQVYVRNEDGNIELIDVDEYLADRELYQPLTNSQLLSLRYHSLPFNNNILNVVNESTSMTEIGQTIKNLLTNLGKDTQSISWYQKQTADQVQKGIEAIQKAVAEGVDIQTEGIDGLYQVTSLSENQIQAAAFAIDYIEKSLPNNQKSLLKLNLNGNENKIHDLIVDYVSSTVSTNNKRIIAPKKDPNVTSSSSRSSSSSGGGGVEEYVDLFTNIIQGKGGSSGRFTIKHNNSVFSINAVNYPDLNLSPSNKLGNGTFEHLMNYGFSSLLKSGKYVPTFGDQPIEITDYKDITYLNDTKAVRALLPIKEDEFTKLIVPDLEFVEKHQDLVNLINERGLKDPQVIQKLKDENIIDPTTGLPNIQLFQPYLCINGLASDSFVSPRSSFVSETKDDKFLDLYDKSRQAGVSQNEKKEDDIDRQDWFGLFPGDWFGQYQKLYTGTIYLPLTENPVQTQIGAGTNVKVSNADNYEQEYLIGDFNRQSGLRGTSSQQLLN